jgi:hypothetical protein
MSETLSEYMGNEYFVGAIGLFAVLYISQCQINLPQYITSMFNNDIFKIIYLSLLLMIPFKMAPHVAITVSIVFVLSARALFNE